MKLDTERALHVLENHIRDRRCGKTTIALSNVCNHLLLGNQEIYCRLATYRQFQWILPMLTEIIRDNYQSDGLQILSVRKHDHEIRTTLGTIGFFTGSMEDYENDWLRGREGLIVDLVDY
jgi:hypothetical protein